MVNSIPPYFNLILRPTPLMTKVIPLLIEYLRQKVLTPYIKHKHMKL